VIEGSGYEVQSRPRPARAFNVGDRVFHQKFGYGEVRSVDTDKLTIAFEHSGEKRVMDSFVVPAAEAG
jgi:DNA helicase-2/ATP-dependent DNA helicase PcrA